MIEAIYADCPELLIDGDKFDYFYEPAERCNFEYIYIYIYEIMEVFEIQSAQILGGFTH